MQRDQRLEEACNEHPCGFADELHPSERTWKLSVFFEEFIIKGLYGFCSFVLENDWLNRSAFEVLNNRGEGLCVQVGYSCVVSIVMREALSAVLMAAWIEDESSMRNLEIF